MHLLKFLMATDTETTVLKRNKYSNSLEIQGIIKSGFLTTESGIANS